MRIPIPWARMGLTHRIIFYVVVVAAVPVALIAVIGFRAGSQGIRSQTQAHLKSVVLVKAQEVERWYRPLEATARILVESANVKLNAAALLGPENTGAGAVGAAEADLVAYLDGIARRQIGLQGIAILSPDLKAVVASTTSSQAFNLQDVSASMKQGTAPNLYLERYAPRRQPANAIVTAQYVTMAWCWHTWPSRPHLCLCLRHLLPTQDLAPKESYIWLIVLATFLLLCNKSLRVAWTRPGCQKWSV